MAEEQQMSNEDAEAWLDMVDQSRLEAMIILDNISKGFIQHEEGSYDRRTSRRD